MAVPVDGYIRVSSQGDRKDERFVSPKLQREAIERLADREGLVVKRWFEEINASGGDSKRPKWNEVISRVEQGKTRGIAVLNLSRFSRSQVDALKALERIRAAGGTLYSAQEGTFDESSAGTLLRDMLFRLAQFDRDRARESFYSSKALAIAAGKYAAKTPFGYLRNPETQGLEPDPETGHLVTEVFERRAGGESWTSMARWLIDQGSIKTAAGVRNMVHNRAYLGVAWASADLVNEHAHTPLVSRLQWDRAHQARGVKSPKTGRLTDVSLLQGLAVCAGCGNRMYVGGGRYKDDVSGDYRSEPSYYCRGVHGSGKCPERSFIRGKVLDAYVEERILRYLETVPAAERLASHDLASELVEARKQLEQAEYEVAFWAKNTRVVKAMGENAWTERLEELATIRNLAQAEVDTLGSEEGGEDSVETILELWATWTIQSKREFLSRMLSQVVVKPAHGRRNIELGDRIHMKVIGSKSGGFLKIYGEDADHWAADGIKAAPDLHYEWNDHSASPYTGGAKSNRR